MGIENEQKQMLAIVFQGFILQASLILALGAQNLFVLDAGLKKRFPYWVALVCAICDLILVFLGVLGAATLFIMAPWLKVAFGALGVVFLFYHGVRKAREFFKINYDNLISTESGKDFKKTLLAALGFSLLNPHVYLDTVVLIGGYSAKFPSAGERAFFGLGAGTASVIWFFSLAFSAVHLGCFIKNAKAMRWVSLVSGMILLALGCVLGWEVLAWVR